MMPKIRETFKYFWKITTKNIQALESKDDILRGIVKSMANNWNKAEDVVAFKMSFLLNYFTEFEAKTVTNSKQKIDMGRAVQT